MMMDGNLTLSGENTIQYTHDILLNCTLKTEFINQYHPNNFNKKIKIKKENKNRKENFSGKYDYAKYLARLDEKTLILHSNNITLIRYFKTQQ